MPSLLPLHISSHFTFLRRAALAKNWRVIQFLVLTSIIISCSRADDKPPEDSAMANMPGMDMSGAAGKMKDSAGAAAVLTEITFTAAQIERGKIKWERVSSSPVAVTAIVPGQIIPNEDRTSRIGAPASGRVMFVSVRPGESVSEGQVLVTIQSPEATAARAGVANAQAEVQSSQAALTYATSALDRAVRLLALKAISKQEHERALADLELARSQLSQAQSELERARSTAQQLGVVESATGLIQIRSPLNGVVISRPALPGTFIEAGTELVVVTDPASLWLSIQSPENFVGLFTSGGRLRFTVPAYPADTFAARVDAIGAALDPDSRTLSVRGAITGGTQKVRPGMLASVIAEGRETVTAVMLPQDAVQIFDGKPTVFVAQPDDKGGARIKRKEVEVRSRSGGRVAVTSGITAGDVVVVQGAFSVKAQFKKGSMGEMEMGG